MELMLTSLTWMEMIDEHEVSIKNSVIKYIRVKQSIAEPNCTIKDSEYSTTIIQRMVVVSYEPESVFCSTAPTDKVPE